MVVFRRILLDIDLKICGCRIGRFRVRWRVGILGMVRAFILLIITIAAGSQLLVSLAPIGKFSFYSLY